MSDMPKLGNRELIVAAVGPCPFGESRYRGLQRLGGKIGYSTETLLKFWKGQYDSKPLVAELVLIGEQQALLAAKVELAAAPDRGLADALRASAGQFHSVAGRG